MEQPSKTYPGGIHSCRIWNSSNATTKRKERSIIAKMILPKDKRKASSARRKKEEEEEEEDRDDRKMSTRDPCKRKKMRLKSSSHFYAQPSITFASSRSSVRARSLARSLFCVSRCLFRLCLYRSLALFVSVAVYPAGLTRGQTGT